MPKWEYKDYLGWDEQGDGKLFYGLYVQNGRIKGEQKKALRAVIERYELPVTLTPHQNIILRDVDPAWKADISATLAAVGLGDWNTWDSLDRCARRHDQTRGACTGPIPHGRGYAGCMQHAPMSTKTKSAKSVRQCVCRITCCQQL